MSTTALNLTAAMGAVTYRAAEHHGFKAAGVDFRYLVPSGAIFSLEGPGKAVLQALGKDAMTHDDLMHTLVRWGYAAPDVEGALAELVELEAVVRPEAARPKMAVPAQEFPLQRVVLNITNQCNLACTYCYEYSDDRIAQTAGKQKYMSAAVAEASVEMLLVESGTRPNIHVTFFGGETLLNFRVMCSTVLYAESRAAEMGKHIEFSLTTNATLLNDEIIAFLSDHRVGVTVSIDGDRELNDSQRVFHNGKGTYDTIVPNIQRLLKRRRTNSIGARVTLTAGVSDVRRVYKHLIEEVGFDAAGFSPATASPNRLYHIGVQKMDNVLDQFAALAWEYRDDALLGKQHGFTNASDTIKELHTGISKAYACGAGLGLLGVGTEGEMSLCHRFVDSPVGKMGNVFDGIDRDARSSFLDTHHVDARKDCATCWARPVCAGGCYHEAFIQTGSTSAANLHYCDWIRGWNDVCLQIYGEIAMRNPDFLGRFGPN